MKIKRVQMYDLQVTALELEDLKAAINWTVSQPNSMPVEMNKRLLDILSEFREVSE